MSHGKFPILQEFQEIWDLGRGTWKNDLGRDPGLTNSVIFCRQNQNLIRFVLPFSLLWPQLYALPYISLWSETAKVNWVSNSLAHKWKTNSLGFHEKTKWIAKHYEMRGCLFWRHGEKILLFCDMCQSKTRTCLRDDTYLDTSDW